MTPLSSPKPGAASMVHEAVVAVCVVGAAAVEAVAEAGA